MSVSVPTSTAPKRACLPFKRVLKTSSAKVKENDDEEDSLSLFRRSNEVFPDVIRDQEERIREKEREKEKARRSASVRDASEDVVAKRRKMSLGASSDESDSEPMNRSGGSVKRQDVCHLLAWTNALTYDPRHSTPRSCSSMAKQDSLALDSTLDADLVMDVKGKGKEILRSSRTPSSSGRRAPMAKSPNGSASSSARRRVVSGSPTVNIRPSSPVHINLEDDDDEGDDIVDLVYAERHRMFSDNDPTTDGVDAAPELQEVEPEDEFARFVLKAREKKAAEERRQASGGAQDPVVNIILESTLPGTEPMTVKRRLSQTMELLLKTWVSRNRPDTPIDVASGFFLMWRGIKIFDTTTLESLGVKTDAAGNIRPPRSLGHCETTGYVRNGLLFQVHDESSYKAYLDQRAQMARNTTTAEDDGDSDVALAQETPAAPKKTVAIILKAKDLGSLKVNVDRTAPIQNLIDAFRTKHGISKEKRIVLNFDGDDLTPEAEVNDYDVELDDTNQFEVYIK